MQLAEKFVCFFFLPVVLFISSDWIFLFWLITFEEKRILVIAWMLIHYSFCFLYLFSFFLFVFLLLEMFLLSCLYKSLLSPYMFVFFLFLLFFSILFSFLKFYWFKFSLPLITVFLVKFSLFLFFLGGGFVSQYFVLFTKASFVTLCYYEWFFVVCFFVCLFELLNVTEHSYLLFLISCYSKNTFLLFFLFSHLHSLPWPLSFFSKILEKEKFFLFFSLFWRKNALSSKRCGSFIHEHPNYWHSKTLSTYSVNKCYIRSFSAIFYFECTHSKHLNIAKNLLVTVVMIFWDWSRKGKANE